MGIKKGNYDQMTIIYDSSLFYTHAIKFVIKENNSKTFK